MEPWGHVRRRRERREHAYGDDHPGQEEWNVERRARHDACKDERVDVTPSLGREDVICDTPRDPLVPSGE